MDVLLALIVHERDRQAVRAAVRNRVAVHFITRAADLGQPWPAGEPTAVLAELADAEGISPVRALMAFRRRASAIPMCAYIPLTADAVRRAVRLAARGVVTDVISVPGDDLHMRLRHLLRHARAQGEAAALRHVWRPWTPHSVWDIVATCIAASGNAASNKDVARMLNRSPRTLNRQLAQAGLPSVHRILGWCRLLRAAYRLDQFGITIKAVSAELGYSSPHAFVQLFHRHTGFTIGGLRAGSRYSGVAAHVQAELLTARLNARLRSRAETSRRA